MTDWKAIYDGVMARMRRTTVSRRLSAREIDTYGRDPRFIESITQAAAHDLARELLRQRVIAIDAQFFPQHDEYRFTFSIEVLAPGDGVATEIRIGSEEPRMRRYRMREYSLDDDPPPMTANEVRARQQQFDASLRQRAAEAEAKLMDRIFGAEANKRVVEALDGLAKPKPEPDVPLPGGNRLVPYKPGEGEKS